jgi:hypothetical protein
MKPGRADIVLKEKEYLNGFDGIIMAQESVHLFWESYHSSW